MKFSDIKLFDQYDTWNKGQFVNDGKRIARILGFYYDEQNKVIAFCQHVLRSTFKPSGKSICAGIYITDLTRY